MISKELYEEVQKDYIDFKNITQDEYITIFNKEEETVEYVNKHNWYEADSISIYKLAHKCKEWALSQGFSLSSSKPIVANDEGNQVFNYWWCAYLHEINKESFEAPLMVTFNNFNSETEPEAIFKACQWILDNK